MHLSARQFAGIVGVNKSNCRTAKRPWTPLPGSEVEDMLACAFYLPVAGLKDACDFFRNCFCLFCWSSAVGTSSSGAVVGGFFLCVGIVFYSRAFQIVCCELRVYGLWNFQISDFRRRCLRLGF